MLAVSRPRKPGPSFTKRLKSLILLKTQFLTQLPVGTEFLAKLLFRPITICVLWGYWSHWTMTNDVIEVSTRNPDLVNNVNELIK